MRRHLLRRVLFFFLGIVLFYAPFALATRVVLWLSGSQLLPDAHRICLRMPFEWLAQPWMYPTMIEQPMYLIGPLLLPAIAFFVGPVFCGWLCPAGAVTELLGRLIPSKLKLELGGKLNPAPIRYGVLLGMMMSPFVGSYICCTFCNFSLMQALVSACGGDFAGLQAWASFTIVTFFLWFFLLGLFVRGGRGWCNLICPAGAVQGLFHAWGAKQRSGWAIRVDEDRCVGCGRCVRACPSWALAPSAGVNRHACTICRDCLFVCPNGALRYARPRRSPAKEGTDRPAVAEGQGAASRAR